MEKLDCLKFVLELQLEGRWEREVSLWSISDFFVFILQESQALNQRLDSQRSKQEQVSLYVCWLLDVLATC